jgi:cytosine/uracil/thiamine/allantoin permease
VYPDPPNNLKKSGAKERHCKMKNLTEMRYIPTKKQLKQRVTTLSAWRLPKQDSALAPAHVWTNADMDPVRPEHQTWSIWTWMGYWATDTINLGTWETASSILAVGLSWREAIPAVCTRVLRAITGILTSLTDRSWNLLCCNSYGAEWCHRC